MNCFTSHLGEEEWKEKNAMQEYLQELTENANLERKEYGTVMSSEANEIGLEHY